MPCPLFKDFFTHVTNSASRVYRKEVNFRHLEHNPRDKTINMSTKTYILYILGASEPKTQGLADGKKTCYAPLLPHHCLQ